MMNMMNYILCSAGMTVLNNLSQQQGIHDLVTLTLWQITSWTQHNKHDKCSTEELLSHTATKDALTVFSSTVLNLLETSKENNKLHTVAWQNKPESTHRDLNHLSSSQEEADTMLILHAVDASKNGETELTIYSLDTDVLVLCPRRLPDISSETIFMTETRDTRRKIPLNPIYLALWDLNTHTLPGFHSFSGADITGTVAGNGNLSFWKAFKDYDIEIKQVFSDLGKRTILEDHLLRQLEHYVSLLYQPDTTLVTVNVVSVST